MTEVNQVYKCSICGNIVEVLHNGQGQLICCNKPMNLVKENTVDASKEKHVPSIKVEENKVTVTVGIVDHPMEEKHYIEWIEIIEGEKIQRRDLKPGERPEAVFNIDGGKLEARAYCNLHGLWKAEA